MAVVLSSPWFWAVALRLRVAAVLQIGLFPFRQKVQASARCFTSVRLRAGLHWSESPVWFGGFWGFDPRWRCPGCWAISGAVPPAVPRPMVSAYPAQHGVSTAVRLSRGGVLVGRFRRAAGRWQACAASVLFRRFVYRF